LNYKNTVTTDMSNDHNNLSKLIKHYNNNANVNGLVYTPSY